MAVGQRIELFQNNGKELRYFSTSDLQTIDTYRIPKWSPFGVGKKSVILQNDYQPTGKEQLNIRSRIAQSGISYRSWTQIASGLFHAELLNYSKRDIILNGGFGIGPLYQPSPTLKGEELIESVKQNIEADMNDLVFRTMEGGVISVDRINVYQAADVISFGIRVNREKLWEVDNTIDEPLEINGDLPTRQAVDQFLVETNGQTSGPFGVTTTMPVSVHGMRLTLQPHLYGLLHSPSLIYTPDPKYNWNNSNGNHSGVRLEFSSEKNQPITRHDLPNYVFFTGHE